MKISSNIPPTPVISLIRHWPGLQEWSPPKKAPKYVDALMDRRGLVFFSAAELESLDERFSIGGFLVINARAIDRAGIIIPDGTSQVQRDELSAWAENNVISTTSGEEPFEIMDLKDFCDPQIGLFHQVAYGGAGFVIGVDLIRSLAMISQHHVWRHDRHDGDAELYLPGWGKKQASGRITKTSPHRPPLQVSPRRAGGFVRFGSLPRKQGNKVKGKSWNGEFIDLTALAYAFDSDRSADFKEHLEHFEISSSALASCLSCDATGAELVRRVLEDQHALALRLDGIAASWFSTSREQQQRRNKVSLSRTFSPGAIATAMVKHLGITAPLEKFKNLHPFMSAWTEAFHGGWVSSERAFERRPFDAVSVDVTSCYPLVAHHIGWWDVLCAKALHKKDDTSAFGNFAQRVVVNPELLYDPAIWRRWGLTLVEGLEPKDDILPLRVSCLQRPDGNLVVASVCSDEGSLIYSAFDVLMSCVLTKKVPRFARATTWVRVGRQDGIAENLPLCEGVSIDSARDPIESFVSLRQSQKAAGKTREAKHLSTVANALVFGNFARFDDVQVRREGKWQLGEKPGPYNFMPLAVSVAAGARLLLALLDHEVSKRGGVVAYRDTDSSTIPASLSGGELTLPSGERARELSYQEITESLQCFSPLSPSDSWPAWKIEGMEEGS